MSQLYALPATREPARSIGASARSLNIEKLARVMVDEEDEIGDTAA